MADTKSIFKSMGVPTTPQPSLLQKLEDAKLLEELKKRGLSKESAVVPAQEEVPAQEMAPVPGAL